VNGSGGVAASAPFDNRYPFACSEEAELLNRCRTKGIGRNQERCGTSNTRMRRELCGARRLSCPIDPNEQDDRRIVCRLSGGVFLQQLDHRTAEYSYCVASRRSADGGEQRAGGGYSSVGREE
jgi:hypothetical protein